MVNEPGFEQAVSLAGANPRLGVGLHLTLLDGHSTLRQDDIPGLVNEQREFTSSPALAGCRYFLFPGLRAQLRAEITVQFKKFHSTGLALDHVNSHHHIHSHPVVFDILMDIAAQEGVTRLRLPFEPSSAHGTMPWQDRINVLFHSKMSARARHARHAVTRITRALPLPGLTLCQVAIHTGRTHQIRVHLNAIGHPIVGDSVYGGVHRRVPGDIRAVQRLERPFLHAARLVFHHPEDRRRMEFIAPLPADLQSVLDDLTGDRRLETGDDE